jgi:hypothetical protein
MAWQAAMSLDAGQFEALELTCRHDTNVRLVLGLSAPDATVTRDSGAGGSAYVYFSTGSSGPNAATSKAVQVGWASWPDHTSSPPPSPWTPSPRPGSPPPSRDPSASPSASAT